MLVLRILTNLVIVIYLCKITISIHQLEPKEPSDHKESTSFNQVISVKCTYEVGKPKKKYKIYNYYHHFKII